MKKVIIILMLLFLSTASNVFGANECASTLSNDLKLHIPVVEVFGNFYLLDIEYVPTTDGFTWLKHSNVNLLKLNNCSNPASLFIDESSNYILRVPLIFYKTTPFWLDLLYMPTKDGFIWFKVKSATLMSNWVFVTSVSGDGNLGSWADAGSKTGLEAGDAICQARANAAGLKGTYKAWLSDDNDDAYCRIHNLSGKKADNCGQGTLPVAAGPWVRTDGFPFGETIEQLLDNGMVYAPVRLDEFGNLVLPGLRYFTATMPDGSLYSSIPAPCANWTSNPSEWVEVGSSDGTTSLWTTDGSNYCSSDTHLICFQTGTGVPIPNLASTGKKAFLTSVRGNGNLGSWADAGGKTGLEAGDAICQSRAAAAGLANASNFKAWLSDNTTDAKTRFSNPGGPWVRLDGVKVADNMTDLTDGSLFSSINLTETGDYIGNYAVWTGTLFDGTKTNDTCNNWTDGTSASQGDTGIAANAGGYNGGRWSNFYPNECDFKYVHLYCLED